MPDANGNIKGIALGGKAGEAWERIFGCKCEHPLDCENADVGCKVEAVLKENADW